MNGIEQIDFDKMPLRWIPISERKPPCGREILLMSKSFDGKVHINHGQVFWGDGYDNDFTTIHAWFDPMPGVPDMNGYLLEEMERAYGVKPYNGQNQKHHTVRIQRLITALMHVCDMHLHRLERIADVPGNKWHSWNEADYWKYRNIKAYLAAKLSKYEG